MRQSNKVVRPGRIAVSAGKAPYEAGRQGRQKKFIKRILSSKLFLFLAILALIGLTLSVGRESYHKYQLTKEINKLKSDIQRLEGRNQQLANLMDYFSEESFLEKEARIKLNLQKPGEKVVIFSDKNNGNDNSSEDNPNTGQIENKDLEINGEADSMMANCWKWWEYFFKR